MIAIKCGRLVLREGNIAFDQIVLIDGEKITAVGADIVIPEGAEIVDASDKWVTPGLIEAHGHGVADMDDINEMSHPITPDMRAFDAVHPFSPEIGENRRAGFTTMCLLPGSANLMGGSGVVLKLKKANTVYDMAVYGKEPFKMALGENPKRCYNEKVTSTRMANSAIIRRTFTKAQEYMKQKEEGKLEYTDPQMEALIPVLKREKRVRIHSHRADDLVSAARFASRFGLDFSVEHVTQGEKIADFLGKNNIPCVVGPLHLEPLKYEIDGVNPGVPAELERNGVLFAITSDETYGIRYLPMSVGNCVAYGMSWEAGIRSITINAARILQIDDRVGSVEPGKDADIAIFNGDPLLNTTRCVGTMIDGEFLEKSF